MVKTYSHRASKVRVLNGLRLALKIDEIREAVFGQQGYNAALLETRVNYEGGKDKRKAMSRSFYCEQREEAEIEEVLKKLQKLSKLRSDEENLELNNRTITKGISCKVLRKESFIDSVAKEGIELEVILKKLRIKRFKRVACKDDKVRRSQAKRRMAGKTLGSMEENMLTTKLNTPLKLAQINKMPDGPVDIATVSSTVVRNLTKRKAMKRGDASHSAMSDSVEDSSKRKKVTPHTKSQVVLEESVKIADGADLRPRFKVKTGLMEEQCRVKAREKGVTVVEDEFKKFARILRGVQLGLQDRFIELERKISQLEGEKNQFGESLTREREAFQLELEKEREAAALKLKEVRGRKWKLYQLRYTKAEILAFRDGNYEVKEIMDEEEVKEIEDGLNVAEKTVADNQETIDQIESLRLRVVDLEGLLEVEKNSSADLQKEQDVARVIEEQTLLYNVEYAEEYEAFISQYEDRLDDNVKLSLKLEEAKSQAEDKTVTLLSRDFALNQLISELAELKERAASGSRHDAELDRFKADLRHLKKKEAKSRADLAEVQAKNKSLVDDLAYVCGKKSIDLARQMSERIDQLTAELAESKVCCLRDNKRAAVTHQSFWELVERDLMQGCFFGRTCVCKLDISSINPVRVMDRSIWTTTAEQIARGREIAAERAPEYMASRTEIGGSSSAVSPTPAVG
ncbi:hypothetical protein GIB67_013772 [Kingdonia uniflora]|uniref:Uncharacterized protein n=1 Tax=Kingdonia uniflora TaxID=39325 RepID=A0A7J7MNP9_9MAGN|nr:hypothetical protein GIB67_013772 [Kingdonia uniflora]